MAGNGCVVFAASYSAASVYDVRFVGSTADNRWTQVWQTKAENKCRLFM
jgi:hypothetical protein